MRGAHRFLPIALLMLLVVPVVAAGTIISNTKVVSPLVGRDYYVSQSDGADWGAKLSNTLSKLGTVGGRITEEPSLVTIQTVVTVSKNHVLLDFYGLKATTPTQAAVLLTIAGDNVTLQGIELDAVNVTGSTCAIKVTGANVTLRDVVVRGAHKGICLDGAQMPTLDHVVVLDSVSVGVDVANTNQPVITHSVVGATVTGINLASTAKDTRLVLNRFYSVTTDVADASTSTMRLEAGKLTLLDATIERDAADRLKTPDSFIVSANLGVGVTSTPTKLSVSDGGATAQSGLIAIPNNKAITARNAANNADLSVIATDSTNNIVIGGAGIANVLIPNGQVILGGDTNLYRAGANLLKTDDSFYIALDAYAREGAATQVRVGGAGPAGESGISFQAGEVNLYRSSAGTLKTDGALRVGGTVYAASGNDAQVVLGAAGPTSEAGIALGAGADINLYRSAADTLKTDDSFHAVGDVHVGKGTAGEVRILGSAQIQFGSGQDVNLYRSAANVLKTDDTFYAVGPVVGGLGTSSEVILGYASNARPEIIFGGSGDTNLYRSAANTLKTDDSLQIQGNIDAVGTFTVERDSYPSLYLKRPNSAVDTGHNIRFQGYNAANGYFDAGTLTVRNAAGSMAAGSEAAYFSLYLATGGSEVESVRATGTVADGETAMLVRRNVGGTYSLQRVSMGAADSGGTGYKVLRVPN